MCDKDSASMKSKYANIKSVCALVWLDSLKKGEARGGTEAADLMVDCSMDSIAREGSTCG
jgi:hypothetical protein